jgi:N-acetylneuraminic acid mutarotase
MSLSNREGPNVKNKRYAYLMGAIIGSCLLLVITLSSAAAAPTDRSNASNESWRILADMQSGRGNPGVVAAGDKIYVIGGFFSPGFGYPNSWEVYDQVANNWERYFGLPVTRTNLMAASVGSKIYAIGGFREDAGVIGSNHELYPPSQTWITRTSMITPVSGAGVAVITETIYIIGGFDGVQNLPDVQIFDPGSNSWSVGTPLPTGRAELGAAVLNGQIFAIGGVAEGAGTTNLVEVYDPVAGTWSAAPPLPAPRVSAAVAVRDGKIYVAGGTDNWALKTAVNTTFVFDPGTNSWSTTTPLPTARWATKGAVIGDVLYVVGGAGENGAGTANEAYPFAAAATTLTITDDPDPSWVAQPFSVNFSVSADEGTPTGMVTVTVDNRPESCTASLVGGQGSCQIAISAPGSFTLRASYSGNSVFAPSSDTETHTVLFGTYLPLLQK